jgi:hypothetical protein
VVPVRERADCPSVATTTVSGRNRERMPPLTANVLLPAHGPRRCARAVVNKSTTDYRVNTP